MLSGLRVDQVGTWFVNMRKRVLRPGQGLPAGTRLPVKDASFPKQVHRENFAEASLARGGDAEVDAAYRRVNALAWSAETRAALRGPVMLSAPSLCYFNDMAAFHPINVILDQE